MQNQQLQVQTKPCTQITLKTSWQESNQEILLILKLANMAAPANLKQDDSFFKVMADMIVRDYPDVPMAILDEAINNGIRGNYSEGKNVSITSIAIFNWVKQRVIDYKLELNAIPLSQAAHDNLFGEANPNFKPKRH